MKRAPDSEVVAAVGGLVDESSVALCLYGEDLEPDEIGAILGTEPTHAHRRGDRSRGGRLFEQGAWLLEHRGMAPESPDALARKLLARLPEDPKIWRGLVDRFEVRVRIAIHFEGWNRGFGLSASALACFARLGVALDFDLYAYDDEEEREPTPDRVS